MSCPGDNWIVPSANPNNVQGGVQSVTAGTPNVTIGGTISVPSISVTNTGGVTQLEGLVGNINLNGVGMTIVGATPTPQDITFTPTVQNIVAGTNCSVVQSPPGTFTVSRTGGTGGGTFTTFVVPVRNVGSATHPGGGLPNNLGAITGLPTVDPTKNTNVLFTLTMCGIGTLLQPSFPTNDLTVGVLQNNVQGTGSGTVFNSGLVNLSSGVNWNTTLPAAGNFTVRYNMPLANYQSGNFNYALFCSYPLNPSPYYGFTNLQFQLSVTYLS
jgi:hypothetical protein